MEFFLINPGVLGSSPFIPSTAITLKPLKVPVAGILS